jgi:hypothetical protein
MQYYVGIPVCTWFANVDMQLPVQAYLAPMFITVVFCSCSELLTIILNIDITLGDVSVLYIWINVHLISNAGLLFVGSHLCGLVCVCVCVCVCVGGGAGVGRGGGCRCVDKIGFFCPHIADLYVSLIQMIIG